MCRSFASRAATSLNNKNKYDDNICRLYNNTQFKKILFGTFRILLKLLFLNSVLLLLFIAVSGLIYKLIIIVASVFSFLYWFQYLIFYFRFKIEFQNQYLLYCHGFKTLKIAYQDIQYLQIVFLGN